MWSTLHEKWSNTWTQLLHFVLIHFSIVSRIRDSFIEFAFLQNYKEIIAQIRFIKWRNAYLNTIGIVGRWYLKAYLTFLRMIMIDFPSPNGPWGWIICEPIKANEDYVFRDNNLFINEKCDNHFGNDLISFYEWLLTMYVRRLLCNNVHLFSAE